MLFFWAQLASAAVTHSHVKVPGDPAYITSNDDSPNHVAISGTSNGTTGDKVDLLCYDGPSGYKVIKTGISVGADGSFSTSAPASSFVSTTFGQSRYPNWTCVLRAVPTTTTPPAPPGSTSPFHGPTIAAGEHRTTRISSGPNSGLPYDFYIARAQRGGLIDYDSLGGCGLDDSYVLDSTNFGPDRSTGPPNNPLFYCNDTLFSRNGASVATPSNLKATRSELRVDGKDAYLPGSAYFLFSGANDNPGFPRIHFRDSVDRATGNLTITESERPVVCEPTPGVFPATPSSCSRFKAEHVKFSRRITQSHNGRFVLLSDRWRSTDHHAHKIDLQLENDIYGDNGDSGYKFPWVSRHFHTHKIGDTIPGPHHAPGSIFVKESQAAANGDQSHPRGAITFSNPPRSAKFIEDESQMSRYDAFVLHYVRRAPAHGSTRLGFIYSDAFKSTQVAAFAHQAQHFFKTHAP